MQTKLYNVVISETTKQLDNHIFCIIRQASVYEVMQDGSQRLLKITCSCIRQSEESAFAQRGAS